MPEVPRILAKSLAQSVFCSQDFIGLPLSSHHEGQTNAQGNVASSILSQRMGGMGGGQACAPAQPGHHMLLERTPAKLR